MPSAIQNQYCLQARANNPADNMSHHLDPQKLHASHHLSRVPPATELQVVNDATAAEETLQSLCSKIDSNSKVARGWKKCQPLSRYQQVKQELSVSNGIILRGTCIIVPEKATRSNDYASSQWSTGDCQDKAFSAQFSLVSRDRKNGGESGQRVPAVSSCKP